MAEVDVSRVGRRRKSARKPFVRKHVVSGVLKPRVRPWLTGETFFSERFGVRSQLRCGVMVPQDRVSSVLLPCSAFPDMAIPVLAAQSSDGHDPKLVEALLLHSLWGRVAELEAVIPLVKVDACQLVSVAAPVAALVTSSHDPVSVSAAGPS